MVLRAEVAMHASILQGYFKFWWLHGITNVFAGCRRQPGGGQQTPRLAAAAPGRTLPSGGAAGARATSCF